MCEISLLFLLSSPINQVMTPHVYLVTLWKGLTRRLGISGLKYEAV